MIKHKKYILVLAILIAVGSISLVTVRGSAEQVNSNGVRVSYPDDWKAKPYKFYTSKQTTMTGQLISSPDDAYNIGLSAPYKLSDKDAPNNLSTSTAYIVKAEKTQSLPNTYVVSWIRHDTGNNIDTYVAHDELMSGALYSNLKWTPNGTTIDPNFQSTFEINGKRLVLGYNSQQPFTKAQATEWLQSEIAMQAHAILVAAAQTK